MSNPARVRRMLEQVRDERTGVWYRIEMVEQQQDGNSSQGSDDTRFVHHARVVAGLTLASRFAGLARDAVCSRVFGAGPLWSAFAFAFLVPNLFRRLFGEGALTAAFLPRYTTLHERNPQAAQRFARAVTVLSAVTLISIVIIGEIALWFWHRQTAATSQTERTLALQLTMIMLPYMPLVCLVAVLGAVLQVHGRFGPTAAAPVILNIVMISAALMPLAYAGSSGGEVTAALEWAIHLVALAVMVAGIIQLAWSMIALRKMPQASTAADGPDTEPIEPHVRSMLRTMLPMLLGLGVIQLNTFFDGLIASYPVLVGPTILGDVAYPLDLKSNAILSFTQRLYQFPLGVFGIAIATAIFPALSRTAARASEEGNSLAFRDTLIRGLRLSLFISLPAGIGLILVRMPLATTVFQGGNFEAADIPRIGAVLTGYAPGVCAYALIHLLTRAYYARDNATTPVRISVAMVILNLILNVTLIWPMGEAGLAWSTSMCAWIQVIWLGARLHVIDTRGVLRPVLTASGRLLLSTTVMTAAVIGLQWLLPVSYVDGWWPSTIELVALAGIGIVMYALAARILRQPELRWLVSGKEDVS